MQDKTILLSGFSKTYAMTGWRMGYAYMPPELVEPVVRLIANSVSCTAPFIQYAGIEALTGPQDSVPKMVEEFKKRRDLIVNGLNAIPGISCVRPKGAFYVFPNVKKLGIDCNKLADYLLYEGEVAVLPGTHFGKLGDGYLRLSYANSQENLRKALDRIKAALSKSKK
jgi:aspartate/methionine/tyrosine aminotransferase